MRGGQRPGGRRRDPARRPAESGLTMIEVMVAIGLVSAVAAALGLALVTGSSLTHYQGQSQVASQLATGAVDRVRGLSRTELLIGRDQASVLAQVKISGVAEQYAGTADAWDPAAPPGAGATAALPTTPQQVTVGGVAFWRHWYVGRCWRVAAVSDCGATHGTAVNKAEFLRVVIAVSWDSRYCTGDCAFVTSTLVSNARIDPMFRLDPTTPPPTTTDPPPTTAPPTTTAPPPTTTAPPPGGALAAVWAHRSSTGAVPAALWIGSSVLSITGLVHTNSDLNIGGARLTIAPRIEYVTSQVIDATESTVPAPVRVAVGTPRTRAVANYRPGGSAAVAAGAGYYAVPASACVNGTWRYAGSGLPANATVVYVPCAVVIDADLKPLLVAEGAISVAKPSITVGDPAQPSATGLLTASGADTAIHVAGSYAKIYGNIQALTGKVSLLGSYGLFQCGVTGNTVEIRGSDLTIRADSTCT